MVVRVHVWKPTHVDSAASAIRGGDVGHASLELGSNYLSHVPEGAIKKLQSLRAVPASNKYRSFQEECNKRGTPNYSIELSGLDEAGMKQHLLKIRNKPFHAWKSNCSSTVAEVLKIGAKEHWDRSFAQSRDLMYWEPNDIIEVSQHLKRTVPQKPKGLLGLGFWGL
jgi:hypothetical protein